MVESALAWLVAPALQPLIGAVLALLVSSTVARRSERRKARDTWLASILNETSKYRGSLATQDLVDTIAEIAGKGEDSKTKEERAKAHLYKLTGDITDPSKGSPWVAALVAHRLYASRRMRKACRKATTELKTALKDGIAEAKKPNAGTPAEVIKKAQTVFCNKAQKALQDLENSVEREHHGWAGIIRIKLFG